MPPIHWLCPPVARPAGGGGGLGWGAPAGAVHASSSGTPVGPTPEIRGRATRRSCFQLRFHSCGPPPETPGKVAPNCHGTISFSCLHACPPAPTGPQPPEVPLASPAVPPPPPPPFSGSWHEPHGRGPLADDGCSGPVLMRRFGPTVVVGRAAQARLMHSSSGSFGGAAAPGLPLPHLFAVLLASAEWLPHGVAVRGVVLSHTLPNPAAP